MHDYANEDEALIGLARQLSDAYGEASRQIDQDYACDAIAELLSEHRHDAPEAALIALLDLPFTIETFPLLDEVQAALVERGSVAVRTLLEATLGRVYDPDGPVPERAAEALGALDSGDLCWGLFEVLRGDADDRLKGAAVDRLVGLGEAVTPRLTGFLGDPIVGPWARGALAQVRRATDRWAAGTGDVPRAPDAQSEATEIDSQS